MSEDYQGDDIYKCYSQEVFNKKVINFKPDRRHYKDRIHILPSLNISEEDIDCAFYSNSNNLTREDVEYKLINKAMNDNKYKFDFESYLSNLISNVIDKQILASKPVPFKVMAGIHRDVKLFYSTDEEGHEIFNILSFKRVFIDNKMREIDYVSAIQSSMSLLNAKGLLKKYGHNKMELLTQFIIRKHKKEKQA